MASVPQLAPEVLDGYRLRLRCKVSYHLGSFCPDVDDIVQETLTRFLRASQNGRIRRPESAGAFLSGICNNVIQEYRRRLWREQPVLDTALRVEGLTMPEAELLEMREVIAAALAQLSTRDHELLQAFFLEEKSKEEICQTLSMTDLQFRVALFRAKERFRVVYRQWVKHSNRKDHS